MPQLRDVLVKTVRQWKSGTERGDVNALIRRLEGTLSPLVDLPEPKFPRRR